MKRLITWFRTTFCNRVPTQIADPSPDTTQEAQEALLKARAAYAEAQGRDDEVRRLSREMYELRRRNHFAEGLELAFSKRNHH